MAASIREMLSRLFGDELLIPVIFGENIDEKRNSHGTPLTTDKDAAGTCMAYVDTPPVHVVPKDKREKTKRVYTQETVEREF